MRKLFLLLLFSVVGLTAIAFERRYSVEIIPNPYGKSYIYRIVLKDKAGTPYSITSPEKFLSLKSVERRRRQGIAIDSTDLPVSPDYIRAIDKRGLSVVGKSKWNNTLLVKGPNRQQLERLRLLPFVKSVLKVWESKDSIPKPEGRDEVVSKFESWGTVSNMPYGEGQKQIEAINGIPLHDAGFRGKGMTIAVLDAGYMNVDKIKAFSNANIIGTHNFVAVSPTTVYKQMDHGTKVLSTMAMNQPNIFVGTAPDASYLLLRSEDYSSENIVEEDYWAEAAEYADSIGADIISSSLGYHHFDDSLVNHHYWEQDGHTALISRTASMLADKGIVCVNSAGNDGMGSWKRINFPADADNILTVGAMTYQGLNSPFSSVGPTADGRVKPDVMAIGSSTSVVSGNGTIQHNNGTSFSCPCIAGMVACLWQALPDKTAKEIIDIVRKAGNNVDHPDNIYGYGIPDFWKAYQIGLKAIPSGNSKTTCATEDKEHQCNVHRQNQ